MKIFLTGGTGFIGRHLVDRLVRVGAHCVVVSRSGRDAWNSPLVRIVRGNPTTSGPWQAELEDADAAVNLAGVPLVEPPHRWTDERKALLRASRVETTRQVVRGMRMVAAPPRVLLSASAIGYYGDQGDRELQEDAPPGGDFLAGLCGDWEAAALEGSDVARIVLLRTGLVLGRGGGFLAPLLPVFRLGLGGPWGSGSQWLPWIHMTDQIGIIRLAIERDDLHGPVNLAAPNAVRVAAFTEALGQALRRPAFFKAPGFALRLALGEAADALLGSQRVLPAAARAAGYQFRFPDLAGALADLLAGA